MHKYLYKSRERERRNRELWSWNINSFNQLYFLLIFFPDNIINSDIKFEIFRAYPVDLSTIRVIKLLQDGCYLYTF